MTGTVTSKAQELINLQTRTGMEANKALDTQAGPVSTVRLPDGRLRIQSSPRCTACFSDGKHCMKPSMRLNKQELPALYTKHCTMHGGKQEVEAYHREHAQSIMSSTVENTNRTLAHSLGIELTGPDDTASKLDIVDLHGDPNPKATGGLVPQDTTSIDAPISPSVGGTVENVGPKKLVSNIPQDTPASESLYSVGDATLRKSFQHKLSHGKMNLNEELALIRTLIQDIFKRVSSGSSSAEELRQLVKLIPLADKLLNTIHRIEDTRKVQYTRESLRIDVMRIVSEIRKNLPDGVLALRGEEIRRNIAVGLAKTIGPSLAETGEIVMTRETFKRG